LQFGIRICQTHKEESFIEENNDEKPTNKINGSPWGFGCCGGHF
jgi:hypothetical protein